MHISVILMHIGHKNSSLYHGLIIFIFLSSPIVLVLFFHTCDAYAPASKRFDSRKGIENGGGRKITLIVVVKKGNVI